MKIKIHLCGIAIKTDGARRIDHKIPYPQLESREQGSLYSWQKRKIADATTWLSQNSQYPLIFCLTSPGLTSAANTTSVLSQFINNARKQGMGQYVWVREHTTAGFPHFHFVAEWHPVEHWFRKNNNGETNINRLSRYWSGLFNSDAQNSIRLGSFHPKTGERTYYATDAKQCWYLAKYIGKNIGEQSTDYLAESGFPQLRYRKTVRAFHVSRDLAKLSQPLEYESQYEYDFVERQVMTTKGLIWANVPIRMERSWGDNTFSFRDSMLLNYSWRNTGHGNTFVGYLKK